MRLWHMRGIRLTQRFCLSILYLRCVEDALPVKLLRNEDLSILYLRCKKIGEVVEAYFHTFDFQFSI